MDSIGGREGFATVERTRQAMAEEDGRLSRKKTYGQVGNRLVNDAPGRVRRRGATALRSELELGEFGDPSIPPEFDTEKIETTT